MRIESKKSLREIKKKNLDKITKLNNKIIKRKIRAKNPHYLYFNLDSSFIYESRLYKYYYFKLSNNNQIKLTNYEISSLKDTINSI